MNERAWALTHLPHPIMYSPLTRKCFCTNEQTQNRHIFLSFRVWPGLDLGPDCDSVGDWHHLLPSNVYLQNTNTNQSCKKTGWSSVVNSSTVVHVVRDCSLRMGHGVTWYLPISMGSFLLVLTPAFTVLWVKKQWISIYRELIFRAAPLCCWK